LPLSKSHEDFGRYRSIEDRIALRHQEGRRRFRTARRSSQDFLDTQLPSVLSPEFLNTVGLHGMITCQEESPAPKDAPFSDDEWMPEAHVFGKSLVHLQPHAESDPGPDHLDISDTDQIFSDVSLVKGPRTPASVAIHEEESPQASDSGCLSTPSVNKSDEWVGVPDVHSQPQAPTSLFSSRL
jgi:hypothetical protein